MISTIEHGQVINALETLGFPIDVLSLSNGLEVSYDGKEFIVFGTRLDSQFLGKVPVVFYIDYTNRHVDMGVLEPNVTGFDYIMKLGQNYDSEEALLKKVANDIKVAEKFSCDF